MVIKKFLAPSMREALVEIKNELGESAVILKTRKVPSGKFPFSGSDIEVTAGVDEQQSIPAPALPAAAAKGFGGVTGVYARPRPSCIVAEGEPVTVRPWLPPGTRTGRKQVVNSTVVESDPQPYADLRDEVRQLAELVRSSVAKPAAAPIPAPVSAPISAPVAPPTVVPAADAWEPLRTRLVAAEVSHDLVASLIDEAARSTDHPAKALATLERVMRNRFSAAGPIRCASGGPRVVAFVGPTGVGKTTTVAKLAARCRMGSRRRVSLITMDTYRIAAIEQIKTLAGVIQAGLHVIYSADEIPKALAACAGDDLVFVDTAGRSRQNPGHLDELRRFLDLVHPVETHLVLSATTKDSDLRETIDGFAPLGINRLLFTKLDETARVGNIFSAAAAGTIPVSFLAAGQNIPDDIELAQPTRFIERLWRGVADGR